MLEKSFGLLFHLNKPKNYVSGEVPVYLRITVDGVEKEMSVKRSWEPARWDVKANKASGTKEDAKSLTVIPILYKSNNKTNAKNISILFILKENL